MIAKPKFLFDNRLDDGTLVASSTASGYSVENLRDWRPYTYWKPSGIPASVKVTSGSATDVGKADYFYLAGHNVFSSRCAVQVLGTTDPSWGTNVYSVASTNLIADPDDLSTSAWTRRGSAAAVPSDAVAPNGTRTACKVTVGEYPFDGIYQFKSTWLYGASVEPSVWLRKISSSGILVIANPQLYEKGAWRVDFAKLSDDWEWIDRYHPAVSVQYDFFADGDMSGLYFFSSNSTPLSFWLWRAGLNTCGSGRKSFALNAHGDRPFFCSFGPAQYPYWALFVHPVDSGTAPTIGIAAFGRALESEVYLDAGFDPRGRDTVRRINRSISGVPLGSVIEHESFERTLQLTDVSWDWLRNSFEPAWRTHLRAKPFAFAWDPADHPKETILVSATGGYTARHRSGGYCTLEIPIQGTFEG